MCDDVHNFFKRRGMMIMGVHSLPPPDGTPVALDPKRLPSFRAFSFCETAAVNKSPIACIGLPMFDSEQNLIRIERSFEM